MLLGFTIGVAVAGAEDFALGLVVEVILPRESVMRIAERVCDVFGVLDKEVGEFRYVS
jgi:hypothetical protein